MIYWVGGWRYIWIVNPELCAKFYDHYRGIQRGGQDDTKTRHLRNWYHLKDTLTKYQSGE